MKKFPKNRQDSAGLPWQGRTFKETPYKNDSGQIFPELEKSLQNLQQNKGKEADVIAALANTRVLIPLLTDLGEDKNFNKKSELSLVTVAAADGRNAIPIFSDIKNVPFWSKKARPIPIEITKVALAAVKENTDLLVLDPATPHAFVVRRPAVWALAQQKIWTPSYENMFVQQKIKQLAAQEKTVISTDIKAGKGITTNSLGGGGIGPELQVKLVMVKGLTKTELQTIVQKIQNYWLEDNTISTNVDSFQIQVVSEK